MIVNGNYTVHTYDFKDVDDWRKYKLKGAFFMHRGTPYKCEDILISNPKTLAPESKRFKPLSQQLVSMMVAALVKIVQNYSPIADVIVKSVKDVASPSAPLDDDLTNRDVVNNIKNEIDYAENRLTDHTNLLFTGLGKDISGSVGAVTDVLKDGISIVEDTTDYQFSKLGKQLSELSNKLGLVTSCAQNQNVVGVNDSQIISGKRHRLRLFRADGDNTLPFVVDNMATVYESYTASGVKYVATKGPLTKYDNICMTLYDPNAVRGSYILQLLPDLPIEIYIGADNKKNLSGQTVLYSGMRMPTFLF